MNSVVRKNFKSSKLLLMCWRWRGESALFFLGALQVHCELIPIIFFVFIWFISKGCNISYVKGLYDSVIMYRFFPCIYVTESLLFLLWNEVVSGPHSKTIVICDILSCGFCIHHISKLINLLYFILELVFLYSLPLKGSQV